MLFVPLCQSLSADRSLARIAKQTTINVRIRRELLPKLIRLGIGTDLFSPPRSFVPHLLLARSVARPQLWPYVVAIVRLPAIRSIDRAELARNRSRF